MKSPIDLDMDRVHSFIQSAPALPDSGLLRPSHSVAAALSENLARRNLRRFLKAVLLCHEQSADSDGADRLLQWVANAVLSASDVEIVSCMTDPEITAWINVAGCRTEPRQAERLAHVIAARLLPELAGVKVAMPQGVPAIRTEADPDGGLTLIRPGIRVAPQHAESVVGLTLRAGEWHLVTDDGEVPTQSWNPQGPAGAAVQHLRRLGSRGPWLTAGPTGWLYQQAPDGAGFGRFTPPPLDTFAAAMASGFDLLRLHYPDCAEEIEDNVHWLVSLEDLGYQAHNFTIPGFRGLISSSPRPSYLAAQTLAHETAHNKMNTILELTTLCVNPEFKLISPVVEAERDLPAVFHGAYAFSQDVLVTRALLDKLPDLPGLSMRRYLAEREHVVELTLSCLLDNAELTALGASLCKEIEVLLGTEAAS